jgi:hypothetical protein
MRGWNFVVYIVALTIAVSSVSLLVPQYNNGNGMPLSPGSDNLITRIQGWSLSALSSEFGAFGNGASVLDLAAMGLQLIIICITGFILIATTAIYAYPIIMTVAPFMPPVFGGAVQAIIYISEIAAFVQVVRGVPWGLNE